MELTEIFVDGAKWIGLFDLACAFLTVLAFIFQWGVRFRLVGVTAFTAVLTAGLFGLSLGLFERPMVPGAERYALVYDSGGTTVSIAVAPGLDDEALEATLQQAAIDLYSPGRSGPNARLTVRARAIVHPEPGVSEPLYLGQIERSLAVRQDENARVELFHPPISNLADLPSAS